MRVVACTREPLLVRNMLVNTTYKDTHVYGRHSTRQREFIERSVPSIVDTATWGRAQEVLREHFLFGIRTARRQYLLRGLIKCALCGLTYIGTGYKANNAQGERILRTYYVCNGKHNAR